MASANAHPKDSTFKWEGRDRKGAVVKGVSEGPSEAAIKLQLRKQGINPTRVNKQLSLFGKQKKPIKGQDIAVFSRQLATMMSKTWLTTSGSTVGLWTLRSNMTSCRATPPCVCACVLRGRD